MKNFSLAILFILISLISSAQEFEVISFEIVPNDLTARTNSRVDGNGRKCAVIKVYADDHIAAVRGASIGEVAGVGMEKLVYMAHDSKVVELVFDHHFPLKITFEDFGYPTITGQMTYLCKLQSKITPNESPRSENIERPINGSGVSNFQETRLSSEVPGELSVNDKKYRYVDLGLPSGRKWAIHNIGANLPEEYGDFFAWGETAPKNIYSKENSLTYGKTVAELIHEGIITENGILSPRYDAARINWGESWRMPTKEDLDELYSACSWIWIFNETEKGYKVIGPNNNYLFLPVTGGRYSEKHLSPGVYGNSWSSLAGPGMYSSWSLFYTADKKEDRGNIELGEDGRHIEYTQRYAGLPIRPVLECTHDEEKIDFTIESDFSYTISEIEDLCGCKFEIPSTVDLTKYKYRNGIRIFNIENGIFKDAGIKNNFLILEVNNLKIKSTEDFLKVIKETAKSNREKIIFIKGSYTNGRNAYYAIDLADKL